MLLNFTYFDLNVEFGQIALKTSSDTYLLMNMNCIGLKLIPCKFSIISLEISIFLVLYTFCQYLISIHTGKTIYHCLLQNFVRIPSCPSMVYKSSYTPTTQSIATDMKEEELNTVDLIDYCLL